jgi:hypothetical protein
VHYFQRGDRLDFCFAHVSSRYREESGMEFYEFEFLSTHYHLVANNGTGCITDFLQDVNALIARELNALRGTSGGFFDRAPGIQTVVGDGRVLRHCVYTLANAVAAGIVHKTAHWKGSNSLRMEYGREYVVAKPRVGLWSKKVQHKHRKSSQDSGRADFAGRSKLPDMAVLKLDRPPILRELSDGELRAKIREALTEKEAEVAEKRAGKPVLGMKAALKIDWRSVPADGEELFGRQPNFSTETVAATRCDEAASQAFSTRVRGCARSMERGGARRRVSRRYGSDAAAAQGCYGAHPGAAPGIVALG